ncbi:MAG: tyrosine-type recombinase/integrase [Candidatus Brocadiia bacterium]
MAHVYKRDKRWWGSWTGPDGKRVRKSLPGVTTKREAQKIANAHEAKATRVRAGLDSALDNSSEVARLLADFLLHKLRSRRYSTVTYYRTSLGATVGHFETQSGSPWPPNQETPFDQVKALRRAFKIGPLGAETVEGITREKVELYTDEHRERLSTRTLNIRVNALKSFLEWARKSGRIATNPLAEMSRVGKPAKSTRALDVHEVEALLDVSPEPYHTIWLALLTTGMRKGELVKLKWPQVDCLRGTITVLAHTSKSKRDRVIAMTPDLRSCLLRLEQRASDPDGYVFVNQAGRPWRNNLDKRFTRCVELALVGRVDRTDSGWRMLYRDESGAEVSAPLPAVSGWKEAKAKLLERRGHLAEGVTLHTCRHSYATALLRRGVDVKVVSELLGHASVQITMDVYQHVFETDRSDAVAALPFGNGKAHPQPGVTTESQQSRLAPQDKGPQHRTDSDRRIAL